MVEYVDMTVADNYKRFDYEITCFNRGITMIFKNFKDFSYKQLFDNLEYNYFKWCDDAECQCCEETLINKLPSIYKKNLVCIIYNEEECE